MVQYQLQNFKKSFGMVPVPIDSTGTSPRYITSADLKVETVVQISQQIIEGSKCETSSFYLKM